VAVIHGAPIGKSPSGSCAIPDVAIFGALCPFQRFACQCFPSAAPLSSRPRLGRARRQGASADFIDDVWRRIVQTGRGRWVRPSFSQASGLGRLSTRALETKDLDLYIATAPGVRARTSAQIARDGLGRPRIRAGVLSISASVTTYRGKLCVFLETLKRG